MPPGNSKRNEFGPKGPIEDIESKEPCQNARTGTILSRGLSAYQRFGDARSNSQKRCTTAAVDLSASSGLAVALGSTDIACLHRVRLAGLKYDRIIATRRPDAAGSLVAMKCDFVFALLSAMHGSLNNGHKLLLR
jgi:hypothetical protein